MKKVIITGASGFIGKALAERLLRERITVYAIVRDKSKLEGLEKLGSLITIEAGFEDYHELHRLIRDNEIDVFYHVAKFGNYGNDMADYNVQLTNTKFACDAITQAIKIKCKRFVLMGTSYHYQKNNDGISCEDRRCSIYGAARLSAQIMCETIAHNNKMHINTVLLTNCFGAGDYSKRSTNSIIETLLLGRSPNLIEGNHKHDWVYINDLVEGLLQVGLSGVNFKTYYIGSRQLKTFREIIEEVRDIVSPDLELNFGSYNDSSYIDYSLIDLDALYNDTGFECTANFKKSIKITTEWVKTLIE